MKSTFAQYVIGFTIRKWVIQTEVLLRVLLLKIFQKTGFARFVE